MRFQGKVALVTGGSRGIGRATCLRLAQEGAAVVVNYFRHADEAQAVVESIQQLNGRAIAVQADMRDAKAVNHLINESVKTFQRLDICVNNAGILHLHPIPYFPENDWDDVLATNLKGVFLGTKYASRYLLKQGQEGRIINVASTAANTAYPTQSAYAASKAAVIAFTHSAAREFARFGITVNAIAPGGTLTDMTANLDIRSEKVTSMIPLGRLANPDEIAAAIAFLASSEASYITGQVLHVNGGEFM
jgi:3-oxoacyl-[acyl-carrier protein] reductase